MPTETQFGEHKLLFVNFLRSSSNDNIWISMIQFNLIRMFAVHLEECSHCSVIVDPYETALFFLKMMVAHEGKGCCQEHPSLRFSNIIPTKAQSGLDPVWSSSIDTPSWPNPEMCIMWNPKNAIHNFRSVCVLQCRYRSIIYTTGTAVGTFIPGLDIYKSPTQDQQ